MDSQRHGLYDDFQGYRVPTVAELINALRTATIVADANVLLNLYRYNEARRSRTRQPTREVASSRVRWNQASVRYGP